MKRFITVHPKCDVCKGELVMNEIQIDLPNCCYVLSLECLICGEESFLILSLEDFIDISRLLPPDQNLLKGGNDETPPSLN